MFLRFFAILAILATVSIAQPVVDAVVDAVYDWDYDVNEAASTAALADTLAGADTAVLYTDFVPKRGYEYVLVRDAITGTGSDSAYYYIHVRCKDARGGNVLYAVNVDTVNGAAGLAEQIPFGGTLFGNTFDIWLIGTAASTGGQVIINRHLFFRRKPVATNKEWR